MAEKFSFCANLKKFLCSCRLYLQRVQRLTQTEHEKNLKKLLTLLSVCDKIESPKGKTKTESRERLPRENGINGARQK